jgi:3-deoxy-7-phosphoheptulonate synthase
MQANWTPDSWKSKNVSQAVAYPDEAHLQSVLREIAAMPPLVTSWEVEDLKGRLASASRGEAFLLQGGDCAESFDDCGSGMIADKLKILLQMSVILIHGIRKPVIRVGRIAGQYAKPRSAPIERRGDVELPSYRGDLVNRQAFTEADRTPNPDLLLRGYERAALTLNFVRALAEHGFADLRHPENWDISFSAQSSRAEEYHALVDSIRDSITFVEAVIGNHFAQLEKVEFFTSHEALSLNYESAQTRKVPRREGWYNLSTHFPWIGMRTAELDGAHVEYCRGIENPVGIKVGPAMDTDWLLALLERINPENQPGRITLIHRMGASKVEQDLPPLLEAVQRSGASVLWCSDPMHGNTETTADGIKTRRFDNIVRELELCFDLHRRMGTTLGGVHLEMTGENVTECVGGSTGLEEADLHRDYRSRVDPRLNYEQALEVAMLIASRLRRAARL